MNIFLNVVFLLVILLILVPLLHLPKIKLIISKFNLNCKIFVLDSSLLNTNTWISNYLIPYILSISKYHQIFGYTFLYFP